jgi:hypothetical protein
MNRLAASLALPVLAAAAIVSGAASSPHHGAPGAKSKRGETRPSAYRSAYFAATVAGAWSRYAMTSDGKTESTYTYRRLPDDDGRARVELRTDFTAGEFAGTWSTNRYVLSPTFHLEDDALSFARHCERLFMQSDKMTEEQEMPQTTLPYVVAAGIDYAHSATFAGTETIEGRTCDHYTYHYVSKEKNRTIYDGEIWMDATVPFGLVRESASIKPKVGKPSKYTMTLTATGSDSEKAE